MADINSIIRGLEAISVNSIPTSESDNSRICGEAIKLIQDSNLDGSTKTKAVTVLSRAANPSGWYYSSTGIEAGVNALRGQQGVATLNPRNLRNMVSDGAIFSIEFIKRGIGTLRRMKYRTGVKKHRRGGKAAYNAWEKGLLTVFDMEKRGYRSIPMESIQKINVGGQSFNFSGVEL